MYEILFLQGEIRDPPGAPRVAEKYRVSELRSAF